MVLLKKKYMIGVAAAVFAMQVGVSQAWNAIGHDIIAQIAYDNMTPVAQQDVDYLISNTNFSKSFSSFTPYVFSAPWPDYLNYEKPPTGDTKDSFELLRAEAKTWHYTNDPIVVGNYNPPPMSVDNSVWAINYLVPNLTQLLQEKNYDLAAYDLVFVTHIVGDIHQPLHSAILYDSDFPNGDEGGNAYPIHSSFGANELHAAWDDGLGQFVGWSGGARMNGGYHPSPTKIKALAKQYEALCGTKRASDLNPADWEKESHALAASFVYPMHNPEAPALHGTLSSAYITQGQQVVDTQVCVAGKRLANVLNKVFTAPIG